MKTFKLILLLAAFSIPVFAQTGRYDNDTWTVLTSAGRKFITPQPGSVVTICTYPANFVPCSNLATLYTDNTGTVVCNGFNGCQNPLTADSKGNFGFWALPGQYQYTYTFEGVNYGPFSVTLGNPVPGVNLSGNQTIAGVKTFTDGIVANNTGTLNGHTWASPGPIGGTTPDVGTFTVLNLANGLSQYWGIPTAAGGLSAVRAAVDVEAQGANISATNLLFVPTPFGSAPATFYRASAYISETQAATSSSTMPAVIVTWTDAASSAVLSKTITATDTGNTTGSFDSGTVSFNAKPGTHVQYSTSGYVSSGATPMQYSLHIRLEQY